MNTTYTPTLEQVKPYLSSVEIGYNTRPNWGAPDGDWVEMSAKIAGFESFEVVSWDEGKKGKNDYVYDMPVKGFLMMDKPVSAEGIWIYQDYGREYNQIRDYAKVREKIMEVIRIAYVLEDKSLLVSSKAVNRMAEVAFREMLKESRYSQVRPKYCVVKLTPVQWENVRRMKEPQTFKGNTHRQYVHDPWITMECENVIVWDVKVWEWEGNRHWEVTGQCVFLGEESKVDCKKDYPMDYWD